MAAAVYDPFHVAKTRLHNNLLMTEAKGFVRHASSDYPGVMWISARIMMIIRLVRPNRIIDNSTILWTYHTNYLRKLGE